MLTANKSGNSRSSKRNLQIWFVVTFFTDACIQNNTKFHSKKYFKFYLLHYFLWQDIDQQRVELDSQGEVYVDDSQAVNLPGNTETQG